MSKILVYTPGAEERQPTRLKLIQYGADAVYLASVDSYGTTNKTLLKITDAGVWRLPAANSAGVATDEDGKVVVLS